MLCTCELKLCGDGEPCGHPVTQEDLLCDLCRACHKVYAEIFPTW